MELKKQSESSFLAHKAVKKKWSELSDLEKFKYNLNHFGFIIPKNAEFYKVKINGKIGMKVGKFIHSCHVETSNVVILLHINESGNHNIQEYWGCWDLEKIE